MNIHFTETSIYSSREIPPLPGREYQPSLSTHAFSSRTRSAHLSSLGFSSVTVLPSTSLPTTNKICFLSQRLIGLADHSVWKVHKSEVEIVSKWNLDDIVVLEKKEPATKYTHSLHNLSTRETVLGKMLPQSTNILYN